MHLIRNVFKKTRRVKTNFWTEFSFTSNNPIVKEGNGIEKNAHIQYSKKSPKELTMRPHALGVTDQKVRMRGRRRAEMSVIEMF